MVNKRCLNLQNNLPLIFCSKAFSSAHQVQGILGPAADTFVIWRSLRIITWTHSWEIPNVLSVYHFGIHQSVNIISWILSEVYCVVTMTGVWGEASPHTAIFGVSSLHYLIAVKKGSSPGGASMSFLGPLWVLSPVGQWWLHNSCFFFNYPKNINPKLSASFLPKPKCRKLQKDLPLSTLLSYSRNGSRIDSWTRPICVK